MCTVLSYYRYAPLTGNSAEYMLHTPDPTISAVFPNPLFSPYPVNNVPSVGVDPGDVFKLNFRDRKPQSLHHPLREVCSRCPGFSRGSTRPFTFPSIAAISIISLSSFGILAGSIEASRSHHFRLGASLGKRAAIEGVTAPVIQKIRLIPVQM